MTGEQRRFLRGEILTLTIGGAFQRATVYRNREDDAGHKGLREALRNKLVELGHGYERSVPEEQHIDNICKLADELTKDHSADLDNARFRIGIAQKALNLYLKYLWCLGWAHEPPHCPFDAIIIDKFQAQPTQQNWTEMDNVDDYKQWVSLARQVAQSKSLAEWELTVFNQRSS